MINSNIFCLTLASIVSLVHCNKTGMAVSVGIEVVDKFKNYTMPLIMKEINSLDIGKIDFDKGYMDNIQIKMQELSSVEVWFSAKDSAINIHASDA